MNRPFEIRPSIKEQKECLTMAYAILRFAKKKMGGVTAAYAHNERKKEAYKSNPDIDAGRQQDNYHLVMPKQAYRRKVVQMIAESGCRTRKDSVVMVETLITASPEFMGALPPPERREFFQRALQFMQSKIGRGNIISAVVHMDERTPHMHLSFCPITPDKKLSAKTILGNQAQLSRWQSDYHAAMSKRWPELERGISSMETGRKHIPVWLFKTAERLDKRFAEVQAALADIGAFNAGKKRDRALALLAKWLPDAERFTAQIKKVDGHVKSLEQAVVAAENRATSIHNNLREHIAGKDDELLEARRQAYQLSERLRKQEQLIRKISPEVLAELKA
jgi:hypothetical protein